MIYICTAGEIEARDEARKRNLSATEWVYLSGPQSLHGQRSGIVWMFASGRTRRNYPEISKAIGASHFVIEPPPPTEWDGAVKSY